MSRKRDTETCPVGHGSAVVNDPVAAILAENERRKAEINAKFNPITGENSVGERVPVTIKDMPEHLRKQWLPVPMLENPFVRKLIKAGSIAKFIELEFQDVEGLQEDLQEQVARQFIKVRSRYDFPFWAASFAYIKPKGGGKEILFRISKPQRKLLAEIEKMRLEGRPIRLVLLKARQWGGSTLIQIYMLWLQLLHDVGLNSLVVAHVRDTAIIIRKMFERVITRYPAWMLHDIGDQFNENEEKLEGVGGSTNIKKIPQRDCMIKVGSAERPESARGDDYNLVHCSEVGIWKATDNKTPEEIVQSAISGVGDNPLTMIVYESTAKGSGNFFHNEWMDAKEGNSDFAAVFVPWLEIPWDSRRLKDPAAFAHWLYENRGKETVDNVRQEPGVYLWKLWNMGATLEGINWYIHKRKEHTKHAGMASEAPSDDIEAFTFAGRKVFDDEDIDRLKGSCKPPKFVGDIYGKWDSGAGCLEDLRIRKEENGRLQVWQDVEKDTPEERVNNRYLVVVDVCRGLSEHADLAVIAVFDRIYMIDGEPPTIVAQWRGHIEMDRLAWKATQIAEYYNHAFLVIESNTLETNNTRGQAEYILTLVREVYDNLYARKSDNTSNDVREKAPVKYGFHTNVLTKRQIITNLQTVVRERLYIERDKLCLDEYMVYIENEKGGYEAPSGYHDDILMTRAIGMQVCLFEMDMPQIINISSTRQHTRIVNESSIT